MAEHDYVIDNQSAPSFRTDLNNALMAIVSQNSKSTAPTTTYANMIWYDTTNNQLKKRNEANSAWIVLGTIDEGAGTFTPSGERALATQAQAEAGTDNATVMTPLRAAQAIAALAPAPTLDYELITSTTISSAVSSVSFSSGFDSSTYSAYDFVFNTVKTSANANFYMRYSIDGGSTFISNSSYRTITGSSATYLLLGPNVGILSGVNGTARLLVPDVSNETTTIASTAFRDSAGIVTTYDGASLNLTTSTINAVQFAFVSANISSGRISMYGIRRV